MTATYYRSSRYPKAAAKSQKQAWRSALNEEFIAKTRNKNSQIPCNGASNVNNNFLSPGCKHGWRNHKHRQKNCLCVNLTCTGSRIAFHIWAIWATAMHSLTCRYFRNIPEESWFDSTEVTFKMIHQRCVPDLNHRWKPMSSPGKETKFTVRCTMNTSREWITKSCTCTNTILQEKVNWKCCGRFEVGWYREI